MHTLFICKNSFRKYTLNAVNILIICWRDLLELNRKLLPLSKFWHGDGQHKAYVKTHIIEGPLFIKTDRINTLNRNWCNYQIKKLQWWRICRHTDRFLTYGNLPMQSLREQNLGKEDLNKQTNKTINQC